MPHFWYHAYTCVGSLEKADNQTQLIPLVINLFFTPARVVEKHKQLVCSI